MDCTFIKIYLDAYERGQLDGQQEKGIREHLAFCQECSKELQEIRAVNALFDKIEIPSLPMEFTQQVMSRVKGSEMYHRGKTMWQEFGKWGASFIAAGLIMLLVNFTSLGSEITTFIANIQRTPINIDRIVEYSPINIANKGLEQIDQLLQNFENRR